jgi:hypothetical protein
MPTEYQETDDGRNGNIYETRLSDLNSMTFYKNYLTKSIPLLIQDGCEFWPALIKWNSKEYLSKEFGIQSILIHRLDRGTTNINVPFKGDTILSRRNNFADFVKKQ